MAGTFPPPRVSRAAMIKTEQLTKRYPALTAVDGVTFQVSPGEVLGFLGPNGAGKTTTMRMLAGFIAPTSGTASICGHDVGDAPLEAKAALGYLPEGAPLYGEMSVRGFLNFIADLRGLRGERRSARLAHVIEHLQLAGVLAQNIDTLSKGFRRRVGLAQAIVHDPPVLILDEPTDGLDPNQKQEVRTLIEEVQAACTRAIIIARGRIVADDTPAALAARSRYHNAVSMQLEDPAQLSAARAALSAVPEVASVEVSEREARLTALPRAGQMILPAVSELTAHQGVKLKELHL